MSLEAAHLEYLEEKNKLLRSEYAACERELAWVRDEIVGLVRLADHQRILDLERQLNLSSSALKPSNLTSASMEERSSASSSTLSSTMDATSLTERRLDVVEELLKADQDMDSHLDALVAQQRQRVQVQAVQGPLEIEALDPVEGSSMASSSGWGRLKPPPSLPEASHIEAGPVHHAGGRLKCLPTDSRGQIIFPICLGGAKVRVSLLDLGYLPIAPSLAFHSESFIYPIGFTSKRKFFDIADGTKKTYYVCKILLDKDENAPLFQITPQSEGVAMESSSLADLFRDFMQRFDEFARMESDWPLFRSGEEFFGLDHPPVIKYLQNLPNAHNCLNFKRILD